MGKFDFTKYLINEKYSNEPLSSIDDYVPIKDNAKAIKTAYVPSTGDRYYGYSMSTSDTVWRYPDGVEITKTDYHEPGDMFSPSDRGTYYKVTNQAGKTFSKTFKD